ncbi:hypothetical protein [Candidatus Ichthyocystis sparus]|uniref:hypothetical protein n=1 Tax=Candidatus Ichthyocystis sparus TaxID=1561004 RepID=UPI000B80970C|nr:hypothetical protein [Candidatus Ichthyocystis sparus]
MNLSIFGRLMERFEAEVCSSGFVRTFSSFCFSNTDHSLCNRPSLYSGALDRVSIADVVCGICRNGVAKCISALDDLAAVFLYRF